MPRRMQTNSFEKGMNKSLTKDRVPPTNYRDAQNFRLSDDGEKSGGALVNVLGNSLEFEIPCSPSCWVVKPIPNIGEPPPGTTDDLVITTTIGVVNISFTLLSGGYTELFNLIIDQSGPGSPTDVLGVKIVRTSPKSIAVFSDTINIIGANIPGQSPWTVGTELASIQCELEVIGWTELRDSLVLFTTNDATQDGGPGQIWFVTYDKALDTYTPEIRYVCDNLSFSKWHPIEAVSRYENSDIQRVYWTDNFNRVRSLNIANQGTSMGVDPNFLDLEPGADFSKPVLKRITAGGQLKAGIYQYAYRLKSTTGAITKFSPASNLINVVLTAESGIEWDMNGEYNGTPPGTPTAKSVLLTIDNLDSTYDTVEIAYLYYGALAATPEIYIFEKIGMPTTGTLIVTHTGAETQIIVSESEYKSFGIPFERAKTISYQDNRLLVGNLKAAQNEKLKFHSRAYRFGNTNVAVDYKGSAAANVPFNTGNSWDLLNPTAPLGPAPLPSAGIDIRSYVPGLDQNEPDWGYPDPEALDVGIQIRDAVNDYNEPDWLSKFLPFKFQSDGITLGGEGPYIKYEFTLLDWENPPFESYRANNYTTSAPILSSNKPTISYDFNTNGEIYNSTDAPRNTQNPYQNNTIRGYMTGEIYRFGIVLYDKSGNPGFVNWIGDIKFPERWEIRANMAWWNPGGGAPMFPAPNETKVQNPSPGYESLNFDMLTPRNNNSTAEGTPLQNQSCYALNNLGLKFTVTIPPDIIDGISGYEIVRVKRESADKTKVTQGVADTLANPASPYDEELYLLPKKGSVFNNPADNQPGDIWEWDPFGSPPATGRGIGYEVDTIDPIKRVKKSLVVYSPEFQFKEDIGFTIGDRLRIEYANDLNWLYRYSPDPQSPPFFYPDPAFPVGPDNLRVYAFDTMNYGKFLANVNANYGDEQDSTGDFMRCNSRKTIEITFAREVDAGEQISNIPTMSGPTKFRNATIPQISYTSGTPEEQLDGCQCVFMTLDCDDMSIIFGAGGFYGEPLLVTYERHVEEQYGGNTQQNRSNNLYIKTAGYISIIDPTQPTTEFEVFGGDIYHLEYDWTRVDGGEPVAANADAARDGMVFPLLSTLNTNLRTGRHLLNKAEPAGTYPPATDAAYLFDTYELEYLYDREQDYVFFLGRPVGVPLIEEFDNRVRASNAKINGELVDQWRQWDIGTYLDVEGSLGPINKLISYSGQNFFFQDHGCGFLLINPSAAVSTLAAGQIQMGYGNILHDFNYISTEIGCFHQWMPVASNDNLFFIDIYSKQMYAIKGQSLLPVSLAGGMAPWFTDKIQGAILTNDNPIMNQGITSTWDRKFNEVWITLNNFSLNAVCEDAVFDIFEFQPGFKWFAIRVSDTCLDESNVKIGSILQAEIFGSPFQFIVEDIGASGSYFYMQISGMPWPYTNWAPGAGIDLNVALLPNGTQNMTAEGIFAYLVITVILANPGAVEYRIPFLYSYNSNKVTVVYNEAYDIYTGFYSHTPPIYINDGTHVLSPKPLDRDQIYKHNSGEYCKFYENLFDSSIELAINDSKGVTKVFDNVSYHSEVWSHDANPPRNITEETFDTVRFYTDFQNTDWIALSLPGDIVKRVEREWQLDVARNAVSQLVGPNVDIFDPANLNPLATFKPRLRDKTMTINLKLDNTNNRRFLLHYLKTFYRFSPR